MPNFQLTDRQRELLTAAVDGELAPAQDAELRQLLAESVAANEFYRRLRADQKRLQSLPPVPAPAGLLDAILRSLMPTQPARPAARKAGWAPYVLAASVFLAVAVGSFWVFVSNVLDSDPNRAERMALPKQTPRTKFGMPREHVAIAVPESLPLPREVRPSPDPGALATRPPTPEIESAPFPRTSHDVVGSRPGPEAPSLTPTLTRLPLLAAVAEFDRPEIRTRLLDDLGREPAHRLDLFTHDSPRALELVQSAAQSVGLALTLDATAQERMRRKLPSTWMIYTESLTADEIAKLCGKLAELARGERGSALGTGHLVPAQAAEARDLRELLGLEPGAWKRPKVALPRSVIEGTVDQLTANLTKNDKPRAKTAVLVTYFPVGHRIGVPGSKEVKAFLEQRQERKGSQVPLIVVIRPSS